MLEGTAPELLQARIRQAAGANADAPQRPEPTASAQPIAAATNACAEALLLQPPTVEISNPLVEQYETLPDEELQKLAAEKLAKIDGRWSRARLIQELVNAAKNPPPPPPAVTTDVVPQAPPAVQ